MCFACMGSRVGCAPASGVGCAHLGVSLAEAEVYKSRRARRKGAVPSATRLVHHRRDPRGAEGLSDPGLSRHFLPVPVPVPVRACPKESPRVAGHHKGNGTEAGVGVVMPVEVVSRLHQRAVVPGRRAGAQGDHLVAAPQSGTAAADAREKVAAPRLVHDAAHRRPAAVGRAALRRLQQVGAVGDEHAVPAKESLRSLLGAPLARCVPHLQGRGKAARFTSAAAVAVHTVGQRVTVP